MDGGLYCPSCGRMEDDDTNRLDIVVLMDIKWCATCASIKITPEGTTYINIPSPGQICDGTVNDPIAAWDDCYFKKPKKRILVKQAKAEIQRAWTLWDGDKSGNLSMFMFFAWLMRNRPYFLTFRGKGDPWQTVHSWLIQHESKKHG